MKFENLMLKGLFSACLLACLLTLGSMLATHSRLPTVAADHPVPTSAAVQGDA